MFQTHELIAFQLKCKIKLEFHFIFILVELLLYHLLKQNFLFNNILRSIFSLKNKDHEELNVVNTKLHDTIVYENIDVMNQIIEEDKIIPVLIKNEDSTPQADDTINNDGEQKKTLAQLRRERMKSQNVKSREFEVQEINQLKMEQEFQPNKSKEPRKIMLALNLLVSVKNFYNQVTKNTRIFQRLTEAQHDIIGDITSFYNYKHYNKSNKLLYTMRIFYLQLQRFLLLIPIITPNSILKILWDILNACLIIILTFFISLYLFFTFNPDELRILNSFSLLIFIIDIFLNFNTSIIHKGYLIKDRKKIIFHYLKNKFMFDLFGISPFLFNFLNISSMKYSFILFLLKWKALQETFEKITFYLNYQKNLKNIVDLVKLIMLLCVICHVFCGFWHILAVYEISQGTEKTWLHLFSLEDSSNFSRYVFSFYYLAVTMITVGYGDITPQNTTEIIFTILTMFVTGITWGFSINKIGNIIDNIEKKDKSYRESMQVIHTLMREENIETELRDQISNYLKYLYNESNEVQKKQEKKVIEKLSNQLRLDLIHSIQGKYLENIPFINKMELKQKIIFLMEECLYSPGETIFKENSEDDCSLFYIVKGEVEILKLSNNRNRSDSVILRLEKCSYFGEISFITGNLRQLTAKATDFCRIYKIKRDKFLSLIKENSQDYEEFMMLNNDLIYKNNYSIINKKCNHCQSEEHLSMQCPKTHLIISKKSIVVRYSFSVPHIKRTVFDRLNKKKWKTLAKSNNLFQAVYQINDSEYLFQYLNDIEQKSKIRETFNDIGLDDIVDSDIYQQISFNIHDSQKDDKSQKSNYYQQNQQRDDDQNNFIQRSNLTKNGAKKIQFSNEKEQQPSQNKMNCSLLSYELGTEQKIEPNINSDQETQEQVSGAFKNLLNQIENFKQSNIQFESSNQILSTDKIQIEMPKSDNSVRKKKRSLTVGINQFKSFKVNQDASQQMSPDKFPSSKQIIQVQEKLNSDNVGRCAQQLSTQLQSQNQKSSNLIQLSPSKQSNELTVNKIKTRSFSKLDQQNDYLQILSQTKRYETFNQIDQSYYISQKNIELSTPRKKSKNKTQVDHQIFHRNETPHKTIHFSKDILKNHQTFNSEQQRTVDGNYFMLQHFDKAFIFKYYYPRFNYIYVVKQIKYMNVSQEKKQVKNARSIRIFPKYVKSAYAQHAHQETAIQ